MQTTISAQLAIRDMMTLMFCEAHILLNLIRNVFEFTRFLGAFAKLWKATISFVKSVRLSIRMEQTGLPLDGFS